MSTLLLISYILLVILLILCPGPMMMFILATAVSIGSKRTLFAIYGGSTAYLILIGVIGLGLGIILEESRIAFMVIKYAGVAYLFYLGLKFLRLNTKVLSKSKEITLKLSKKKLFAKGFFVGISNPKAMLILGAVLPQFINPDEKRAWQIALLGGIFLLIQFVGAIAYAFIGAKLYENLRKRNVEHVQYRITGVILLFAGFLLAFSQNNI